MSTDEIRKKLHEYIDTASDKKVKAFYTIIEDDAVDDYDPLEDASFVAEMDRRYNEYLADPSTAKTLEEVQALARERFANSRRESK